MMKMNIYQIVEHLSHEVHKNCIIIPLSDEFFKKRVFPLLLQMRHDLLLDVVLQRFLEVVIQVLCLVVFIA